MKNFPSNTWESLGYNTIMQEIRLDDIKYDPWGTTVSWMFALADVFWVYYGELLPEYTPPRNLRNPGDFDSYNQEFIYELLISGEVNYEDIKRVFYILGRFDNWCRLAGRNY